LSPIGLPARLVCRRIAVTPLCIAADASAAPLLAVPGVVTALLLCAPPLVNSGLPS